MRSQAFGAGRNNYLTRCCDPAYLFSGQIPPAVIPDTFLHIGKKINALRIAQQLSAAALAARLHVPEETIVRIEDFRHIPDILLLHRIAGALQTSLPELVGDLAGADPDKSYVLMRRDQRCRFDRSDSAGIGYEMILTRYMGSSLFTPALVTVPQGIYRPPVATHAMEFVFVLSGTVITGINDEPVTLYEGDALFYDASIPHSLHNNFDRDCVLLSIYMMQEE